MSRTNYKVVFESEICQFMSEKPLAREGVAIATLTSGRGFAARKLAICGQKGIL